MSKPKNRKKTTVHDYRFADVSAEVSLATINSLNFPFMFIDSSHTILHANNAAASYLKTSSDTFIGKKCPRLRKENICIFCPLDAAIKSGKSEHRDVFDDREKKWYVALVSPLPFVTEKNLPIFILTIVDITDKKLAEENLLQEKIRSSILADNFLELIHKMLELRDPAISKHLKSVSLLATAIAAEIGLDRNTIEGIRIAALLHDIGKISVPSEILARPGRLSSLEYSYIQKHPLYGRDLIAPLSFPWSVSEIIYQHHERMNGSGYPEGILGDKIRLESKIISVAEVVEAMSSHQVYRPAFSIEETLREIETNRGTLYAPEVVDACLLLFREKGFSFKVEAGTARIWAAPGK
jgi:putative nucleotidyltransferase with HDIG domain